MQVEELEVFMKINHQVVLEDQAEEDLAHQVLLEQQEQLIQVVEEVEQVLQEDQVVVEVVVLSL
jgi:hypothetical protein